MSNQTRLARHVLRVFKKSVTDVMITAIDIVIEFSIISSILLSVYAIMNFLIQDERVVSTA